jgi:Dolichyl-phosphate-mannose-protein mannosyltransferase
MALISRRRRATGPGFAALAAIALFLAAAVTLTAATKHYGPTIDEGAQIAAGMQWLDQHRYAYEPSDPPLGRVVDALGPYLAGAHSTLNPNMWREGEAILWSQNDPDRMLLYARLGVLLFLAVASAVVWRWGKMLGGTTAALGSVFLFLTLPPVLAHAGLATTDMAVCSMTALAYLAAIKWLERPDAIASLAAGVAGALALLSKFTAVLFFPAGMLPVLAWRLWLTRGPAVNKYPFGAWARGALIACVAAALMIWGGYRFSTGSLLYQPPLASEAASIPPKPDQPGPIYAIAKQDFYPAPAFFRGILDTALRVDRQSDPVYLLGRKGKGGLWYFFPVVFAVKTPIPFLILALLGCALLLLRSAKTHDWRHASPALIAGGILMGSLSSPVDFGLRYLLPIYPVLAVAAGFGLARRMRGGVPARIAALALGLWAAAIVVRAYPDYLPWFNEFAGNAPEQISVNSDLDWGQDVKRLDTVVRARGITEIHAALLEQSEYDLSRYVAGYVRLRPGEHPKGWIAASQFMLRERPGYAWLKAYKPVATVGHSILLYDIPAPTHVAAGEAR